MTEAFFDRDAERAVLGALLLSTEQVTLVGAILRPEDFFLDGHRHIYGAILDLYEAGTPIDLITVGEELKRKGVLQAAGGFAYLADLAKEVPTVQLASHYARIVKERSIARRLHQWGLKMQTLVRTGTPADEILQETERTLSAIQADYHQPDRPHLAADVLLGEILLPLKRGERPRPLFSPFPSLNRLLGGFYGGQLIIIGARPSHGKTTLALHLALFLAREAPALFFSLETSRKMLAYRVLSILQGAPYRRLDELDSNTERQIEDAARQLLRDAPLYLDDRPGLTVPVMAAKARALQQSLEKGLSAIFVDYLQLIPGEGATAYQRVQELTEMSYRLKAMAQRLDVPVFVLSQLNRQIEQRAEKRPVLSDLRDSGGIEAAADVVLLLHRPGLHDPAADHHQLDVYVEKNRDGATGKISLFADFKTLYIEDPGAREENPGKRRLGGEAS